MFERAARPVNAARGRGHLHPLAPTTMFDTFATAVWSDGVLLYVAGYGNDSTLSQAAALLWTQPLGASTLGANATRGQGCGTLQLVAQTRPVLATTWSLAAVAAPPTTTFGVTWLGLADPAIPDLAGAGLPGCPLRARLDIDLGAWVPSTGNASQAVPLPASPTSLIGLRLFAQAAAFLSPPPNAFGAITSNGVAGTIGDHRFRPAGKTRAATGATAVVVGMAYETEPDPYHAEIDGLRIDIRPQWLAGHFWWRIFLQGHNKVLLRHRDHAIAVAELLADDEARLRREQRQA